MRRILVLRGGALGDFIVTLPALALLRQRWPDACIELAGNATASELARSRGLIDAVHSQHDARWAALYNATPLPDDFARWLDAFDLVISYWPDSDSDLARHFPRHERQRFISAPAMPTRGPAAAYYCDALHPLGLKTRDYFCELTTDAVLAHPPARTFAFSLKDNNPRVALHPGSGSPRKNWPLTRWLSLATWLRQQGTELLFVAGPVETENTAALAQFSALGRVLENASLNTLAAELRACGLFLGHDSGVSHLAAACGTPSLLLFGPTDPAIWAPPAAHVRVLRRTELNALTECDVRAALKPQMG